MLWSFNDKRGNKTGKIPVFGLLKRGGKVYTQVIENTKNKTLIKIIRKKVVPDSIVYSDSFRSYNVLDVSEFYHYRINHSKLFAKNTTTSMILKTFGTKRRDI